jgi:hypothetical protein
MEMRDQPKNGKPGQKEGESQPEWMEAARRHVRATQFGAVVITIHDSRATQIEKLDRTRFESS